MKGFQLVSQYLKSHLMFSVQIAVEAEELFSGVLTDLGEVVDYNPDGEDPILTIFDYVEAMRCQLWEIAFHVELGGDNGAHKNNPPEKQPFFLQAVRRVLYRYFRYVLLPKKAISKVPAFFPNYLDIESPDSMFTPAIIKTWDPIHFQQCGWYLDCPLKKPPPFDLALRDSIQPLLPSPAASIPGVNLPHPFRVAHPKVRLLLKGVGLGVPSGRRLSWLRSHWMMIFLQQVVTSVNHLQILSTSHPLRAVPLKRIRLGGPGQANAITFVSPAAEGNVFFLGLQLLLCFSSGSHTQ